MQCQALPIYASERVRFLGLGIAPDLFSPSPLVGEG